MDDMYGQQKISVTKDITSKIYQWQNTSAAKFIGWKRKWVPMARKTSTGLISIIDGL
jgi:hypothetical protein